MSRAEAALRRIADLAVLVADDRDAEALVRSLQARGWRVLTAIEQDVAGRLATVRLTLAGEDDRGAVTDLLFASSGIEPEVVAAADRLEVVPGLALPVARVGHLIALKVLARDDRTRPQDRVDLAALLTAADAAELREARESLAVIVSRGFQRGRDLLAGLAAAVEELRG